MSTANTKPTRGAKAAKVPPLETGQRLTRSEFYRRWEAMPELKHAERIEGFVYIRTATPVQHGHPHAALVGWLGYYLAYTPGVQGASSATVELDEDNEVGPDALLRIKREFGGQSRITEEDLLRGAPELVGEVSDITSHDLTVKKDVYRRNGVQEYVIWKTGLKTKHDTLWFRLRDGDFEPQTPDGDGVFKSEIFPGLWLDADAMIKDDFKKVLDILQQGLASPEHAAFVQDLQRKAKPSKE